VGSYVRLIVTLTAIAAVASFGLAMVYNATHEITEEYKRQEQASARVEALGCGEGAVFEETVTDSTLEGRQFTYYTAYEDDSRTDVLGYAFSAYGKGYSSTIETVVGVTTEGSICGIKIVSQQETPGLGAKVQEVASQNTLWAVLGGGAVDESGARPWFQEQYGGLGVDELRVVKSRSEDGVLAITGATISSEAVTGSVRQGLAMLLSIVGTAAGETEHGGTAAGETGQSSGQADEATAGGGR
jgi:electron transport complex protein RnfG